MTCQKITGSDVFHQVHSSIANINSDISQIKWSDPQPIPPFVMTDINGELVEGVCDIVPEYHSLTDTILAIGHNVFYCRDKISDKMSLTSPNSNRHPVYAVRKENREWSERKILDFELADKAGMYTTGSAQRITFPNGDILLPISFSSSENKLQETCRMVCTCLCSFDGEELKIKKYGNVLTFDCKRGLLEPSLVKFEDMFYMTIRTEDDRAHVSCSEDGLFWHGLIPWAWEDGEQIVTSTTQQHWLEIGGHLWLVYTRKSSENEDVIRWRSPLYMAKVIFKDDNKLCPCLLRESEQVVLPMRRSEKDENRVALMGNFDVRSINKNEAWLTVGENLVEDGRYVGDTLMAVIKMKPDK